MVLFEVDPGSRFRVEAGKVTALDEPDDMALVLQATEGRTFGPSSPGNPDHTLAQAVIDYWGQGRIIEADDPDDDDEDGLVY